MSSIKQNIEQVITQIASAAEKCGRDADSVQLLAVSKTKPITAIDEAIAAGHCAFGENYVQEGVEKAAFHLRCSYRRQYQGQPCFQQLSRI